MYNREETKAANQEFYAYIFQELANRNINAPKKLSENEGFIDFWGSKEFFFSQTCGLPYRLFLSDKVTLIGTPNYGLEGCKPGYYNSVFIARSEDKSKILSNFLSSKFAFNELYSQSGWAAAEEHLGSLKNKFSKFILSGSHRNSAKLVSEGKADIAAIDALSFKFIKKYDSFSSNLSIIEKTRSTPGLPFIAHLGANSNLFFEAITQAIKLLNPKTQKILNLKGLVKIPKSEYLKIKTPNFNYK